MDGSQTRKVATARMWPHQQTAKRTSSACVERPAMADPIALVMNAPGTAPCRAASAESAPSSPTMIAPMSRRMRTPDRVSVRRGGFETSRRHSA